MAAILVLAAVHEAAAQPRKPRIVPGRDPGGPAVALFSLGIDYTIPEIASRLARDGEGDIVGVDLPDGDNRPYAPAGINEKHPGWGDGTAYAKLLAAQGVRIVPVRVDPADPTSVARGLAFVAQSPAYVAVVPALDAKPARWELFSKVAGQMPDVLVVAPTRGMAADAQQQGPWPAALGLANGLSIAADTDPPNAHQQTHDTALLMRETAGAWMSVPGHASSAAAVDVAAMIAHCTAAIGRNETSANLKLRLLAEARQAAGQDRLYFQRCNPPNRPN